MKSKIRAINLGTLYDMSGNMRRLARQIDRGEIQARDIVILTRETVRPNASAKVGMFHFGYGSTEEIHWMLATAKNRVEPS